MSWRGDGGGFNWAASTEGFGSYTAILLFGCVLQTRL
jgi:hypothetical protein